MAPCSPFILQGGEVFAHPQVAALPSRLPTDPLQTHPMSDDQHNSLQCQTADSLPEKPYREQEVLQHEVSCWESGAGVPQQHSRPGPFWEQGQSGATPAHSASAYAWCCEDDIGLTDTAPCSAASFGGYVLDSWSPELSLAGSPVAIGGCLANPGDSAAGLSSRANQPQTCSEHPQKTSQCLHDVSAEDRAAQASEDELAAEELKFVRSALVHSRGGDAAAANTAKVPALRTEESCQEAGLQSLRVVSDAHSPQVVSAGKLVQLDMSRGCQDEGTQLRPPSLSHAVTAL